MNSIKKPSFIQSAFKKVLSAAGTPSSSRAVPPKTFTAEKKNTVLASKRADVFEKTRVGASKQQRIDPTIQQQKKAPEKVVDKSSPKTPAKTVQKGAAKTSSSSSPFSPFSLNQGFGKDYTNVLTKIPKPKISIIRDRWTSILVSETYQANERYLANKAQVPEVDINTKNKIKASEVDINNNNNSNNNNNTNSASPQKRANTNINNNNNNNNNNNTNTQIQKPHIVLKRNSLGEILVSETFQANKKALSSYFLDSNGHLKLPPTSSFARDFSCINDPQLRKQIVRVTQVSQRKIKECEARLKLIEEKLQNLTERRRGSPKSPPVVNFRYVASP